MLCRYGHPVNEAPEPTASSREPHEGGALAGLQQTELIARLRASESNWRRAEAEGQLQAERARRLVGELLEASVRHAESAEAERALTRSIEDDRDQLAASLAATQERLASATDELTSVKGQLTDALLELERTRATLSWRVTRPLRSVRPQRDGD